MNIEQIENSLESGKPLSGLDLKGLDLAQGLFNGADFSHSNFEGTTFEESDLSNCNFTNTNLKNCTFFRSNLEGVNFKGANLKGANLSGSYLGNNFIHTKVADFYISFLPSHKFIVCWWFSGFLSDFEAELQKREKTKQYKNAIDFFKTFL